VISAVADGVRVTDLESRHGTFVNGERIDAPAAPAVGRRR
jgi:pSer/pThr/pTyr-binding forkhead associated (FHA) protein